MSEILIAYHLRKTWTAERFMGSARAVRPLVEPAGQNAVQPAPAVTDVSFSVETGEIFGLVGPSGSGKSTLLSLLSGQTNPDTGRVEVFGLEPTGPQFELNRLRNRICLVSQMTSSQVFNRLSAVENLIYSARLQGTAGPGDGPAAFEQRAKSLLADLGLSQAAVEQPLSEVSSHPEHFNILQKVALGRALMSPPRLLLLDEVTDGMDLDSRRKVLNALRAYSREYGITMILATRSLRTAAQVCDRINFLSQGRITHMIETDARPYPVNLATSPAGVVNHEQYIDFPACELEAV